jgi:hypothetical protein
MKYTIPHLTFPDRLTHRKAVIFGNMYLRASSMNDKNCLPRLLCLHEVLVLDTLLILLSEPFLLCLASRPVVCIYFRLQKVP